jgi:hypothetical protein
MGKVWWRLGEMRMSGLTVMKSGLPVIRKGPFRFS